MIYKIKLKNADDVVKIDDQTYEYLTTDDYLKSVKFIDNLRRHSSGCVVFQKTWKKSSGDFKVETIYLHKLLAEKFLPKGKTDTNNLVSAKNGDKLDCRIENLVWRSRTVASRLRKSSNESGYTGVYKEHNRYRAVISINQRTIHLGMFATPEEAAMAYNKRSKELFGDDGKINKIKTNK